MKARHVLAAVVVVDIAGQVKRRGWRLVEHDLVDHPLMTLVPPLGHRLHDRDEPFEVADLVATLRRIHTPMDQEVERWPDDDFEPPVTDACFITIQVCQECGHDSVDGAPTFRGWPCPTIRALGAPS